MERLLGLLIDIGLLAFLRRKTDELEGRPKRPLEEDVSRAAYLDVVSGTVLSVAGVALLFFLLVILHSVFGLPYFWSFVIAFAGVVLMLNRQLGRLLRDFFDK